MCVPSIEVFFSLTAGKCVQSDHSMGARIYITFVETCIYLFLRTTTVLRGKTGCGRVAAIGPLTPMLSPRGPQPQRCQGRLRGRRLSLIHI